MKLDFWSYQFISLLPFWNRIQFLYYPICLWVKSAFETKLATIQIVSNIYSFADTIVVLKDKIFGKPESESDAIAMLLKLSDKTHVVITAVTVGIINKEQAKFHTISVSSDVEFAKLTGDDCKEYCKTQEPFDKAGSYGIQGYGSAFIKKINDSYISWQTNDYGKDIWLGSLLL